MKEEGAKATDGPPGKKGSEDDGKENKKDAAKRVHLAVMDANAILDKAKSEQDAKKKVAKLKKKYKLKSIELLPAGEQTSTRPTRPLPKEMSASTPVAYCVVHFFVASPLTPNDAKSR